MRQMPPGGAHGAGHARGSPAAERVRTGGGQCRRPQDGRLRNSATRRPRGISGGQCRRLREAVLPGIRRLLDAFEAFRRAAHTPGLPCPSGLPPPGAGPRMRAPAKRGGPLLVHSPPEKGAIAPALDALPKERRPLGAGMFGPRMRSPRIFGAHLPEATHPSCTLLPRAYIGPAAAPPAPRRPRAKVLTRAPRGLGRAAAEREAS